MENSLVIFFIDINCQEKDIYGRDELLVPIIYTLRSKDINIISTRKVRMLGILTICTMTTTTIVRYQEVSTNSSIIYSRGLGMKIKILMSI